MFFTAIAVLALIFVFALINAQRRPKNLPPGPFRLPIIGNMHNLGMEPHITLPAMAKKYGGLYSLQLGKYTSIVAADYEACAELLKRKGTKFGGRPVDLVGYKIATGGQDLILANWDARVSATKRMMHASVFGMNKILRFEDIIVDESKRFTDSLLTSASAGTAISPLDLIRRFTFGIISRLILGDTRAPENKERFYRFPDAGREVTNLFVIPVPGDFLPIMNIFPPPAHLKRLTEVIEWNKEVIRCEIAQHVKMIDKDNPRDLLDLMLIARDADENRADRKEYYQDEHLVLLVQNMFIAGSDTSAVTTEWFLALMTHYPEVLAKMQAELDKAVGKRTTRWADRDSLPYCNAVIKEVMRFKPIVVFFHHTSMDDVNVNYQGKEYFIPKGAILWAMYGTMHGSNAWKEPDKFIPERFLNISKEDEANLFIPFGVGIRQCGGINLAQVELFLVITHLAQKLNWRTPNGVPVNLEPEQGLLSSARPYQLVFSKRD